MLEHEIEEAIGRSISFDEYVVMNANYERSGMDHTPWLEWLKGNLDKFISISVCNNNSVQCIKSQNHVTK